MNHSLPVEDSLVQEVIEWLRQPVVSHLVSIEVQLVEEDLVELPPHRVSGLAV